MTSTPTEATTTTTTTTTFTSTTPATTTTTTATTVQATAIATSLCVVNTYIQAIINFCSPDLHIEAVVGAVVTKGSIQNNVDNHYKLVATNRRVDDIHIPIALSKPAVPEPLDPSVVQNDEIAIAAPRRISVFPAPGSNTTIARSGRAAIYGPPARLLAHTTPTAPHPRGPPKDCTTKASTQRGATGTAADGGVGGADRVALFAALIAILFQFGFDMFLFVSGIAVRPITMFLRHGGASTPCLSVRLNLVIQRLGMTAWSCIAICGAYLTIWIQIQGGVEFGFKIGGARDRRRIESPTPSYLERQSPPRPCGRNLHPFLARSKRAARRMRAYLPLLPSTLLADFDQYFDDNYGYVFEGCENFSSSEADDDDDEEDDGVDEVCSPSLNLNDCMAFGEDAESVADAKLAPFADDEDFIGFESTDAEDLALSPLFDLDAVVSFGDDVGMGCTSDDLRDDHSEVDAPDSVRHLAAPGSEHALLHETREENDCEVWAHFIDHARDVACTKKITSVLTLFHNPTHPTSSTIPNASSSYRLISVLCVAIREG
ncbi:hypothetical protein BDK51DRAFT_40269 [Blyttiomyces helicus]|uniref:Uncharacterized protein n=1 Tax=Blyttiomyces helicus TaxID=388810 RepID=A0A4P9WCW9_9FUNG|nr:hypothetical protein BDK51DRAFT_40269 [Blyttiomyces helicus]|eukprot:RKO89525.1 hypothetical protein BDK51DRAFT_40269 [Blyttiomyces helicus]